MNDILTKEEPNKNSSGIKDRKFQSVYFALDKEISIAIDRLVDRGKFLNRSSLLRNALYKHLNQKVNENSQVMRLRFNMRNPFYKFSISPEMVERIEEEVRSGKYDNGNHIITIALMDLFKDYREDLL